MPSSAVCERDLARLAVAVVQQLAGVLVPQRLGDAVHQLLVDLGADQPLGADAERRGLADARIGVGGDGVPGEERIALEQRVDFGPAIGTSSQPEAAHSSATEPVG